MLQCPAPIELVDITHFTPTDATLRRAYTALQSCYTLRSLHIWCDATASMMTLAIGGWTSHLSPLPTSFISMLHELLVRPRPAGSPPNSHLETLSLEVWGHAGSLSPLETPLVELAGVLGNREKYPAFQRVSLFVLDTDTSRASRDEDPTREGIRAKYRQLLAPFEIFAEVDVDTRGFAYYINHPEVV